MSNRVRLSEMPGLGLTVTPTVDHLVYLAHPTDATDYGVATLEEVVALAVGGVTSVNGQTGAVTLTSADVGADAAGTAAAAMTTHLADADPHPQYMTAAEVAGGGYAVLGGTLAQFAPTTSAQLAGVISDETGTGALVFGTSPTFTTSIITPQVVMTGTGSPILAGATRGVTFSQSDATQLVDVFYTTGGGTVTMRVVWFSLFTNVGPEFQFGGNSGGNPIFVVGGNQSMARGVSAAVCPFLVKGFTSQTANLQEWRNSTNVVLTRVDSIGDIVGTYGQLQMGSSGGFGQLILQQSYGTEGVRLDGRHVVGLRFNLDTSIARNTSGGVFVTSTIPAQPQLAVRGATSQSANLTEWQNSAGTVLLSVTSGGYISSPTGDVFLGTVGSTDFVVQPSSSRVYINLPQIRLASATCNLNWVGDTGLTRLSAGVVKVTDGGAGTGSLKFKPISQADAAASNGELYYSTDAGKLVYKDLAGVVNALY